MAADGPPAEHLERGHGGARALVKALRPHQWLKNLLVLVPVIADPLHGEGAAFGILGAFVALSLCASAGYVLNDLLDLADDRSHPRKRRRPFAAGALSAATGTLLMPVLLLTGLAVALAVSPALLGLVALYFVATTAYSVKLKRHAIVDICMLAFLFTLRVIAGGAAIGSSLSVWLLAFSMFIFFSLAAVKRLGEMSEAGAAGREVTRRGYRAEDRGILSQMAIASGYLAVLVLALYVDQPDVQDKFPAPWLLWGVCPMLIFWISRMVLVAGRGEMDDDPLVWTLENRTSRLVVAIIAAMIAGALWL
ncbi:UbiA family prenyltransferase [Roseicyclus elongatus]|uniref:UbiA family prenyltransferase n=1 Tax=Roseicyclus elongatus TaxID=159346 RepID=UPI001FDF3164|nr:UbiA family prenyltransferase [Roseibacterium elongatum]